MRTHGWWRTGWTLLCVAGVAALLLAALPGLATAQEEAPQEEAEVTPTPVVGSASGQQQSSDETQPAQQDDQEQATQTQESPQETQGQSAPEPSAAGNGSPLTADPVIAQGLIYLDGGSVVWQVREAEITGSSTVTGNARVILQQAGASVIRNDLTGKRTRLEAGEAYFASAGDPYTTFAEGNGVSEVWIFEISNSNAVGEGAFYLSPNVSGYPEAVYDFEFTRHVASPGSNATVEAGDGPSLVMVLSGQVDVNDESGTANLAERDGLIINGDATVEAIDGQAVVVSMTVGPQVSDTSAAPPEPQETDEADTSTAQPDQNGGAATQQESAEPAQPSGDSGAYRTSVQVGAQESIGVTMYVDGALVYDGWLAPGEWTAFYDGTTFEVYTTSGANTLFQNSCGGDPFFMGYEAGDAYYVLEANANSCAPVGG